MRGQMPDIRFYDFEFDLKHIENHCISVNWSLFYNDIGNFEAHFDLESEVLDIVMKHPFLVAVQGEHSAIIVGKKLSDRLILYGRTCNWLLKKRVVDVAAENNKTLTKIVEEALPYSMVKLLPEIPVNRSGKYELFQLVQESLFENNLGHEILFNYSENKWEFHIIEGNSDNLLIISAANRNAYEVVMDDDLLDFCNEGWYQYQMENMGEWDPESNKVTKDGVTGKAPVITPTNYGKYWRISTDSNRTYFGMNGFKRGDYLVCRQLSGALQKSDNADPFWVKLSNETTESDVYRWDCLLSSKNESDAYIELKKAQISNKIQGKTANLHFGKDYNLGDIVKVEWNFGDYKSSMSKRISGVRLWYENGNVGEEPMFEEIE